jgi:hypothetical protein
MTGTYDVRIWAIRVRKGRPKPYQVRWKAGTAVFARSFGTRGLADSFRSGLIQATRRGEAFDTVTGLPESHVREQTSVTWYQHGLDYIDMKWPAAAGKSRISAVETLTAVTPVLTRTDHGMPDPPFFALPSADAHSTLPTGTTTCLRTSVPPCLGSSGYRCP